LTGLDLALGASNRDRGGYTLGGFHYTVENFDAKTLGIPRVFGPPSGTPVAIE